MKSTLRRRVAYVVSMPYGMDAWTYREIEVLAEQDVEATIFTLRYGPGPYMPKPEWNCYRVKMLRILANQFTLVLKHPARYARLLLRAIETRSLLDFLIAADFSQEMARRDIEIIHSVFGDHKLFISYYCKEFLEVPLTVALYGHDLRDNPNWSMFRRAIAACDSIVVNCQFNKELLAEIAGFEIANQAKIIRHYAELPSIADLERVRILIVGAFEERKGHSTLFDALGSMGSAVERVEIWIAGYPGSVDVMQLARDAGVQDKVRMFGTVSDEALGLLYEQCDLFCLPSQTDHRGVSEGLPVALIEAMAHAKPVITTRIAGIPELVEEVLVEEADVEGFADAIVRFMNDPVLRERSGSRNRMIIQDNYSKNNVSEMRDLILSLV